MFTVVPVLRASSHKPLLSVKYTKQKQFITPETNLKINKAFADTVRS